MRITYTAPNRPSDYPYAIAIHRAGHLYAFVSGFSRLSSRSPIPEIGKKLKRHDFFQTLYLASLKVSDSRVNFFNDITQRLSDRKLDNASFRWAKDSDVFIFHRTQGLQTTKRIHSRGYPALCIMNEVNSHIEVCTSIMEEEYKQFATGKCPQIFADHKARLETYELADYILCPSEFVRRSFIMKGFSETKLLKVNFGFAPLNIEPFSKQTQKETFRLLFVGQINYRKGIRYAIEAFRNLKHPKKEFVIVGPKTSITGIENTNIPDNVFFTGPLKGEQLKEQYRRASVFILPSVEEGLAMVQGEALASGLPLLITTNTGGDDLITDGIEGFIVPPANTSKLTEKMQQMADDPILLDKMSNAALKTAKEIGNWDTSANILIEKLYSKLSISRKKEIIQRSCNFVA